jgi:hypothetical protein
MNYFIRANKNLITFSLITLIVIPIFGINFLISFFGNILLLIFLIPLFFLLLVFLGFNYYKSKINTCSSCGSITLISSETCINCGENLMDNSKKNQYEKTPSETTIEIKAEEVQ